MSMTDEQYEDFKKKLETGRCVINVDGRSAATVAELDFIRAAEPSVDLRAGVSDIAHVAPKDASAPVDQLANPFTPEYIEAVSPTNGPSATQINEGMTQVNEPIETGQTQTVTTFPNGTVIESKGTEPVDAPVNPLGSDNQTVQNIDANTFAGEEKSPVQEEVQSGGTSSTSGTSGVPVTVESLEKLTMTQLRALPQAEGLSSELRKDDLIAAILEKK